MEQKAYPLRGKERHESSKSEMGKREVKLTDKELAFMDELAKHEDQWVAILRNGDDERIVGSGRRLKEAKRSAIQGGFRNVVFMKVPSSHKIFVGSRF